MACKVKVDVGKVDVGSGNIFADLGLPDADTRFLKLTLFPKSIASPTSGSSPRRKQASSGLPLSI